MEYLLRSGDTFEQLEARVIGALARHGFMVQRSFSLHSATQGQLGLPLQSGDRPPGFSVLSLHGSGTQRQAVALVTLYQRQGRTIFRVVPATAGPALPDVPETADLEAELVAALILDGLEICLGLDGSQGCVDAARVDDGATNEPDLSQRQKGRSQSAPG